MFADSITFNEFCWLWIYSLSSQILDLTYRLPPPSHTPSHSELGTRDEGGGGTSVERRTASRHDIGTLVIKSIS